MQEEDVAWAVSNQELCFFLGGFFEVGPEVFALGPVASVDAVGAAEAPDPQACALDDRAAGDVADVVGESSGSVGLEGELAELLVVVVVAVDEEEIDVGVGQEGLEPGVEASLLGSGPANRKVADLEQQVDALMLEGSDGGAGGSEVAMPVPLRLRKELRS